jgi:hypothetical protein
VARGHGTNTRSKYKNALSNSIYIYQRYLLRNKPIDTESGTTVLITSIFISAMALSARPSGLVLPGEQIAYERFLKDKAITAAETLSGHSCDTFNVVEISSQPLIVNDSNSPAANERITLEGCGVRHIQNIEVARFGIEPEWQTRPSVAGESITNTGIQELFISEMFGYAKNYLKVNCNDKFYILDTYVAAPKGNVTFPYDNYTSTNPNQPSVTYGNAISTTVIAPIYPQSWAEVWKLKVCDEYYTNLIIFIPTEIGKISIKYINITSTPSHDLPKRVDASIVDLRI